jgi:hypothetical protein
MVEPRCDLGRIICLGRERCTSRTSTRLSHRFHALGGDSEIWKRQYYSQWVRPRARRLASSRRTRGNSTSVTRHSPLDQLCRSRYCCFQLPSCAKWPWGKGNTTRNGYDHVPAASQVLDVQRSRPRQIIRPRSHSTSVTRHSPLDQLCRSRYCCFQLPSCAKWPWSNHVATGHLAQEGNWKQQYRLRHNWSKGLCRVTEVEFPHSVGGHGG